LCSRPSIHMQNGGKSFYPSIVDANNSDSFNNLNLA